MTTNTNNLYLPNLKTIDFRGKSPKNLKKQKDLKTIAKCYLCCKSGICRQQPPITTNTSL